MNTASVAKTPHRELKKDRQTENISSKNKNSPKELLLYRGQILGCIGKKVLTFLLLAIHSHLYLRILPPPPPPSRSKSCLKLVCNVNIVNGNLKSENSHDNAQKPQRNCKFMN